MSFFSRGNLKVAVASLRKAKWRSLLTMLGVIIGIVSVVTIVGIGEGMKQQVASQISHFGKDLIMVRPGHVADPDAKKMLTNTDMLFGRTSLSGLSQQDFMTIKSADGVKYAAPLGIVSGEIVGPEKKSQDNLIVATAPDLPEVLNQNVRYGSFFFGMTFFLRIASRSTPSRSAARSMSRSSTSVAPGSTLLAKSDRIQVVGEAP